MFSNSILEYITFDRFFTNSNCDDVASFTIFNGEKCVPSLGGYYVKTAYLQGCDNNLYLDDKCTKITVNNVSPNGVNVLKYEHSHQVSLNAKCIAQDFMSNYMNSACYYKS